MIGHPATGDREDPRPELPLVALEVPDPLGDRQPRLGSQIFGGRRLLPGEKAHQWWMEGVEQDRHRPLLAGLCCFEGIGEVLDDHHVKAIGEFWRTSAQIVIDWNQSSSSWKRPMSRRPVPIWPTKRSGCALVTKTSWRE